MESFTVKPHKTYREDPSDYQDAPIGESQVHALVVLDVTRYDHGTFNSVENPIYLHCSDRR